MPGRLWLVFSRALKWVWFPAFGGVAVYPGQMPVIREWLGLRKASGRKRTATMRLPPGLTAVDAGHFPLGFAHFHAGFQIVALVAVGFALAQA